jgi:peptidoglycan hydrolase-like protein with peptidoglycan-binding domain
MMAEPCCLPEEDHESIRRIVGLHDRGEDVVSLQHALNRQLYRPRRYRPICLTWRVISKRLTPTIWGYSWAGGALHEHQKHHVDPFKFRAPNPHVPKARSLKEDGIFGKKTLAALIKYQHKVGLPDDGIAGPEVWEHLLPFWIVKIIVVRDNAAVRGGSAGQVSGQTLPSQTQSPPDDTPAQTPAGRFIGSPFAKLTMDNIAQQLGVQVDKNGLTSIFVMQATWRTEEDPTEIIPGHWEHTGGFQVNTPIGKAGQSLQAYYQLTRAEVLSIKLADGLNITGDLWVQPTVQAPLDSGTSAKPNLPQLGVTAGGTVSLEIKGEKDRPTIKVFLQGAGVATVDSKGHADTGVQGVLGVSTEFDADKIFGGGDSSSKQDPPLVMTADPPVVTLKPGGSAQVKIQVSRAAQQNASIGVAPLPAGVSGGMFDQIPIYRDSGVLHLSATADAPASNRSNILVSADLAGAGEKPRVVGTKIQVIVVP